MDVKALLPLLVQASLILLVAGIGLQSRWSDITATFHQPRLLVRAMIAVNVVVPLVAVVAVLLLPIAPAIKAGIVLMAVSPMAPFAPGKMLKSGAENAYVLGVYVALILAAVIVVPLTVALIGAFAPRAITMPIGIVGMFVLTSVLLPLAAGLLLGQLLPRQAPLLARIANIIAYAILIPVVVLGLYKAGGAIMALIGDGVLVAILATVVVGLAAGHWLGGPAANHRVALANAAVTRHPGLAGLIAHRNFEDSRVMLAVLLFLLTSIVVSGIYSAWAGKRLAMGTAVNGVPDGTITQG